MYQNKMIREQDGAVGFSSLNAAAKDIQGLFLRDLE